MMLILTRRPGEVFEIGENIKVTVLEIRGKEVQVRIEAPSDVSISRTGKEYSCFRGTTRA
jgi:carbon storage regulator